MRLLLCAFALLALGTLQNLHGQCDPPDLLPTSACDLSPAICLTGACYTTVNQPDVGHQGFCGNNTIINNPQYIAFTAIATTVTIEIEVGACASGTPELQAAILDTCVWENTDVLACDPGTPTGGIISLSFAAEIDSVYYLLFDGSNGSLCEYEIRFASGVLGPPIQGGPLVDVTPALITVCQGQDELIATANPAVSDAPKYDWIFPWGIETSSSNLLNIPVPNDAPPGLHNVIVYAYSGCDTLDQISFSIQINEVPDEVKPPETFCPEDFPFTWGTTTISAAGDYRQEFNTIEGCPFDSTWMVMSFPDVGVGAVDTVHCGLNMDYEGVNYTADGQYMLMYPSLGMNGCDSSALLNLVLIDYTGEIEQTCQDEEFLLTITQEMFQPGSATVTYQWYLDGAEMPGEDAPQIAVLDGGTYFVRVFVEVNGTTCTYDLDPIVLVPAQLVPMAPTLMNGDTSICPNNEATFSVVDNQPDITEYLWSAPADVNFTDDGTGEVTMDFGSATGDGTICVSAFNECGEGLPTCFDFTLLEIPTVGIDGPATLCVDSVGTYSFNGNASTIAIYNWAFSGGTPATATGEGPHNVSWNTPGEKNVMISVTEPGCDTVRTEIQVDIEETEAPIVTCMANGQNELTFTWDGITDVSEYLIEFEGGLTSITDTFFTITGLSPNDTVTILIAALGDNTCLSAFTIAGCRTDACIIPTIQFIAEDSICLNGADPSYDLDALVNGVLTDGTWTGMGISDAAAGTFDPVAATPGIHKIKFTYVESPLCTYEDSLNITVFALLDPSFTIDPTICIADQATLTYNGTNDPGTNFTWNFDNPSSTQGSGAGPYSLEWGSPGEKSLNVRLSDNNGCNSDIFTLNTIVEPELTSPIVNCQPNTSTVEFLWSDVANSSGFDVTVLTGPAGIQVGNNISFDGLTPGDTIRIEIATLSDNLCPSLLDTFECVARVCPMPIITLDSFPPLCLEASTGTIPLTVNVVNGAGSGVWSGNGVTNNGGNSGTFDPNAVDAGIGTHQMIFIYNDDGCEFINTFMAIVNETPSSIISNTETILNCDNNNQLELDGTQSFPAAGLNFEWSVVVGNGAIVQGADPSLVTVNEEGTYQLKVRTPEGCVDSSLIVVTQDDGSPVAEAGLPPTLNCIDETVMIGGASTEGADIEYQWITADGAIMGNTTDRMAVAIHPGTYTLSVRNTTNGCESTDNVVVGIDTTSAQLSAMQPDILDCDTETLMLSASITNGLSNLTTTWLSPGGGSILSGDNSLTPTINAPGIYELTVRNEDNGCLSFINVEVLADENIITDLKTSVKNETCVGRLDGGITLSNIVGGTAPYTFVWSHDENETGDQLIELSSGAYSVVVTDDNGCSFEKDFTVDPAEIINLDIDLDKDLYLLDGSGEVALTSNNIDLSDPGLSIVWSYDGGVICEDVATCSFVATTNDFITAVVTTADGCVAEIEVRVVVKLPRIVFVPNVFTPNGDNNNDFFFVFAKDILDEVTSMEIFNRWGELVYFDENITQLENGWDGRTTNGLELESGVYVYKMLVKYLDGEEDDLLSGNVTLLR